MEKLVANPCVRVRIAVRRVQRHPVTKRTMRSGILLKKHVVRGATLSLVPDALNDFGFHHAQVSIDEAIHIVLDQASISAISAMIAVTLVVLRESE
jgi:ribosome-interacting GTPase 1